MCIHNVFGMLFWHFWRVISIKKIQLYGGFIAHSWVADLQTFANLKPQPLTDTRYSQQI